MRLAITGERVHSLVLTLSTLLLFLSRGPVVNTLPAPPFHWLHPLMHVSKFLLFLSFFFFLSAPLLTLMVDSTSLMFLLTASQACQTNSPCHINSIQFSVEITTQLLSLNLESPLHFHSYHLSLFSLLPYCCWSCWPMVTYLILFRNIKSFGRFFYFIFSITLKMAMLDAKLLLLHACVVLFIGPPRRLIDIDQCWDRMFGSPRRGSLSGIFSSWNSGNLSMVFAFWTPWPLESLLSFTSRMEGRRLCWWWRRAPHMWSYYNCICIVFTKLRISPDQIIFTMYHKQR